MGGDAAGVAGSMVGGVLSTSPEDHPATRTAQISAMAKRIGCAGIEVGIEIGF